MLLSAATAAPSPGLDPVDGVEERDLVRRAAEDEQAFLTFVERGLRALG